MNPADHIYSVSNPPTWIPDAEECNELCRDILYLHELADTSFYEAVSSSHPIPHPSSFFSVAPNPCHGSALLRWTTGPRDQSTTLRIFDATGRLRSTFPVRTSSFVLRTSSLNAGVYLLRLDSAGRFATARLVVD